MEVNFFRLEKKILKFWKENQVFEKSVSQAEGRPNFVFYEGPPTTNAEAGLHHLLARAFKDLVCRYKTMRGFRVLRKAGWDAHGLPVELEIEKKLKLKRKKDIGKYGIARFNRKCKKSVLAYKKGWERLTEMIGYWLDMENPYITYNLDYMETVWQILKRIYQKGLIYQDDKVVPYCPRCQTSLSSHEVALGYKKIKEPSIYVGFKIEDSRFKNTYLLVWTTTPWTLPGNVAVAVNPELSYLKIKVNNQYLILAKERLQPTLHPSIPPSHPKKEKREDYQITQEFKGKDLIGLNYQPLYPVLNHFKGSGIRKKKIYTVIGANFVSLEEGTGLVHIAPAFGEEDLEAGKKNNLPILKTVDEEGKMITPGYEWNQLFIKEADSRISGDLEKRGLLFRKELYQHDYPFCWRCHSPLLYYIKKSWFVRVKKVKKDLIKNNQKINWIPAYLKEGRFGEWLKEIKDWVITRERYWGTPFPVWECEQCGYREVIGGKKDLLAQKFSNNRYYILRHGDSLRNQKKIASCWPEGHPCPLTKKGRKDIEKTAEELKDKKIDLIFSSDLLRTKQTAQIVAGKTGARLEFAKDLREVNVGIYNNKPVGLAQKAWGLPFGRFRKKLPGGESYNQVKKRIYNFLLEIDRKYQGKNILIVSHECPLSLLESAMKGFSDQEIVKYRGTEKPLSTGQFRKLDFKVLPYDSEMKLDFHRPYVDQVKFYCPKCGKLMRRVPEVIDCWFDSGSMPFAQYHYPFENKKLIDQKMQFPADFICEGVDQTRGWFYTLLAISTLLGFGPPYKNVISLGHILDKKGEKMSKSKGNVIEPWGMIQNFGADSVRWYFYTINHPGDEKLFSEKDIEKVLNRFVLTFWNSFLFYDTYAWKGSDFNASYKSLRDFNASYKSLRDLKLDSKFILDKWMISELNLLVDRVSRNLEKYQITEAARAIEKFIVSDLSQWYIRRSRRRFHPQVGSSSPFGKKVEKDLNASHKSLRDFKEVSETLRLVLLTLSKLTAPFIPFLSEEIYQRIRGFKFKSSIHLQSWPQSNPKLINQNLNRKMQEIREIVSLALAERAKAKIKIRQPLQKLEIKSGRFKVNKELLDLVREEVNVKEVVFNQKLRKEIELDTKITLKLREEGMVREVIRQIQGMRKKAGLKPKNKILVQYSGLPSLNKILERNKKIILKEIRAEDFVSKPKSKKVFLVEREAEINRQKLWLAIEKI